MSGPGLEIVPFAVNLLPVSHRIAISVKIVLVAIDDLPARLIIGGFRVSVPPPVGIMVPAWLIARKLHQGPVRAAITGNPGMVKRIRLLAYAAAVGNHARGAAGIALNGIDSAAGYFCDDPSMADPDGVSKENLVARLRRCLPPPPLFIILG